MKKIAFIAFMIASNFVFAQQNIQTISPPAGLENIFSQKLFGDSLVSSFVIVIKKEVKLHKHQFHSEHVYIIEGEANMKLGDKNIHVKKDDMIFIPQNTAHNVKVTSLIPLKVISIQAPMFDGKDRVILE